MSGMDFETSSVKPVCGEEFSFEDTAVCDSAGSDSSESLDDVTYDCDCPVYNAECSVGAIGGYDWTESFSESANEIDDCQDNLIRDVDFDDLESRESSDLGPQQTNEVAVQEVTDIIEREHDTLEEMSISSENRADFAECEFESKASSDLFSPEHLARIKAVTDTYRACESEEVLKEEEKLVPSGSDVVFNFDQQLRYNKWSEEMEKEAFQAMMLAELSITQYSGYGVFHANPLIPQEIEGLEPKVTGNHLIWDWMSNEKNYFEITFYKPFTFYADVLLSEK